MAHRPRTIDADADRYSCAPAGQDSLAASPAAGGANDVIAGDSPGVGMEAVGAAPMNNADGGSPGPGFGAVNPVAAELVIVGVTDEVDWPPFAAGAGDSRRNRPKAVVTPAPSPHNAVMPNTIKPKIGTR